MCVCVCIYIYIFWLLYCVTFLRCNMQILNIYRVSEKSLCTYFQQVDRDFSLTLYYTHTLTFVVFLIKTN